MRLARLGSAHQTRLSFMRVLLRRIKAQGWTFERSAWRLDHNGVGVATYRAKGPRSTYTLVCYGHDLPDELRSDRVIAEAWDATFTLFDGEPTAADLHRLSAQVPLQEAGRMSETELVLSRANRSVRLFAHVVRCLADGRQPAREQLEAVGYLMRTTAVYASGKFGVADRDRWAKRPEFRGSFQPELLTVWLIRWFTVDLVEHLAAGMAPQRAVRLAPELRRRLGVGNSTGLGMAPFLITHPLLLNNWITARETALARVRGVDEAPAEQAIRLEHLLARATENARRWNSQHPIQKPKVDALRADLGRLRDHLASQPFSGLRAWDQLYRWAEGQLGLEAQEQLVALLLELYPDRVDPLADTLWADEESVFAIDGAMPVSAVRNHLRAGYAWALEEDFDQPRAIARVWYVSAEKLEPRLGERFEEPLTPYEQALAPGRDAKALFNCLADWADSAPVAALLLKHPEHRHTVRRVQIAATAPFSEIHDNTVAAEMVPIDLLRCKLAFFGATHFDPRSDRWVRITMYQGAPFPDEIGHCDPDDLAYPTLPPV